MQTREEFLRELWFRAAGKTLEGKRILPSLEDLQRTEWSPEFERLMRNRMITGAYRYGRLKENNKPLYDRTASIRERLKLYEATGNLEHLVDVANLCLCEFVESNHPNKHFKAIDDGVHVEVKEN